MNWYVTFALCILFHALGLATGVAIMLDRRRKPARTIPHARLYIAFRNPNATRKS